jgi:cytochrome c-type biogenesis protein CcmH/NrfF
VRLHDLNGFILSSVALFGIAIAGVVKGNRWLSEPGMPVNRYGWLLYLGAAVVMLVNGLISIRVARRAERERAARKDSHTPEPGRQAGA